MPFNNNEKTTERKEYPFLIELKLKLDKLKRLASELEQYTIPVLKETSNGINIEGDKITVEEYLQRLKEMSDEIERKDQEILRDKDSWENTFNAIPDIIFVIDQFMVITRANIAFFNITKIPKSVDVSSFHCYDILKNSFHNCSMCPGCKEKVGNVQKFENLTINNTYLKGSFLFSTTPIVDNMHKLVGSVIILRDISTIS